MATIKSYTDINQSEKLVKILPLDSADMHSEAIEIDGDMVFVVVCGLGDKTKPNYGSAIWSLAALLNVLPAECECMALEHINYGNNHKEYFMHYVGGENTDDYDNPVDACVAMIENLYQLNLL